MFELTPFFNSSARLSWRTVQDFQEFLFLFLAEVVEFDLLILGRFRSIYVNNKNA